MSKIGLIIKREYFTRVRKKSFIVMSIIGPLFFAAIIIMPIWLASREGSARKIEVIDESGIFEGKLKESDNVSFVFSERSLHEAREEVNSDELYAVLHIPEIDIRKPDNITLYSLRSPGIGVVQTIEDAMRNEIESIKLAKSGIDEATLKGIKTYVSIRTVAGEKEGSTGAASAAGYISSFLVYILIFMYGVQVMRGVMEEKANRIVEVIISSVKPFQLMLGKIIGIAAVGLTQFIIWILLSSLIYIGISAGFQFDKYTDTQINQTVEGMSDEAEISKATEINDMVEAFSTIPYTQIIIAFIIYFLGGYLLYSALFAAVGSAVDTDTDSQQFMFPITIPLVFSIIVLGAVLKEPDGALAFWMSMIPLTSPIVMMMRVPFGVPVWEMGLSVAILILGFLFTVWVASRIYRIGILMHGTKVNYKTLAKWFSMKG